MESPVISLIFRSSAIISGIFLLVLSILIYRKTREATKGWFYLSLFGISLFAWSSTAMGLKLLELSLLRHITGIFFLLTIAIFVIYAYAKLADDFWIEKPKWLTARSSLVGVFIIFVLVWGLNLIFMREDFSTNLLSKLLSISHLTLSISFFIAAISTFYLGLRSKDAKWWFAFLACLMAGGSMGLGSYYDGCCGPEGALSEDAFCADYDLDYMQVYGSTCAGWLVGLGKFYQLGILLSTLFIDISFFLIWKGLD